MRPTRAETLRALSQAQILAWGLPWNPKPCLLDLDDQNPPDAPTVARRTLILGHLVGIGFDDSSCGEIREVLENLGLEPWLTERERALLTHPRPSDQEKIDATWWTEGIQVLAWSLGRTRLDHFRPFDEDLAEKLPLFEDPTDFVAAAELRPLDEILEECDLLVRLHWAARERHREANMLNPEILLERHRATYWLAGLQPDWDTVPVDTS